MEYFLRMCVVFTAALFPARASFGFLSFVSDAESLVTRQIEKRRTEILNGLFMGGFE
jgi:hypothetical protein